MFNISFLIKYNLILQIKYVIEMRLKLTRGLSCPLAFFFTCPYCLLFALYTNSKRKHSCRASEFHNATNGRNNLFFFFLRVNWKKTVFPNDIYYLIPKRIFRVNALYFMYVFIMTMETLHSEFHAKVHLKYIGEKYNILKKTVPAKTKA